MQFQPDTGIRMAVPLMAISCVFSLKMIYFPYFYWFHKIYCRLVLLVCEIASGPSFPRVEAADGPLLEPLLPSAHSLQHSLKYCWKTREKPALPEGDWQKSPPWTTQRVQFCTHFYKCKMKLIQAGFGGGIQLSPFFSQMFTQWRGSRPTDLMRWDSLGLSIFWV